MKVKVGDFQDILESTLVKTVNDGLNEKDKKTLKNLNLKEEDLLEIENEYRTIGELFGRTYMVNLLEALLKELVKTEEKEN